MNCGLSPACKKKKKKKTLQHGVCQAPYLVILHLHIQGFCSVADKRVSATLPATGVADVRGAVVQSQQPVGSGRREGRDRG